MHQLSENTPIVTFGPWYGDEWAMFERRCPKCGRLVKADEKSSVPEGADVSPIIPVEKKDLPANATCRLCGRVRMEFLGWISDDEEEEA